MSKAEERALEAYPSTSHYWNSEPDRNTSAREYYKQGYHQAEKDLKLTWEDIELIYEISCDVFNEQDGCFYNVSKIWEEVLKRFKNMKK